MCISYYGIAGAAGPEAQGNCIVPGLLLAALIDLEACASAAALQYCILAMAVEIAEVDTLSFALLFINLRICCAERLAKGCVAFCKAADEKQHSTSLVQKVNKQLKVLFASLVHTPSASDFHGHLP